LSLVQKEQLAFYHKLLGVSDNEDV